MPYPCGRRRGIGTPRRIKNPWNAHNRRPDTSESLLYQPQFILRNHSCGPASQERYRQSARTRRNGVRDSSWWNIPQSILLSTEVAVRLN